MQRLYDKTGFNDHQLHCVMRFDSPPDEAVLAKAVRLSLDAVPILATRFAPRRGRARWEGLAPSDSGKAFLTTEDEAGFESEITRRIREEEGPQIRACLLRGRKDALAVTMNHMVSDAAGFKDYLYFLCRTYARLLENPQYAPEAKIEGKRGMDDVLATRSAAARARAFLAQGRDSNAAGSFAFPFAGEAEARPFIAARTMDAEKVGRLKAFCKARGATINDAVLAAYYRVLARLLGQAALNGLEIPIMIDMRRYLPQREFASLRNLSSTAITRLVQAEGEDFEESLGKAKTMMDSLKGKDMGLGGFLKLSLLFALAGRRLAPRILARALRNPLICMTNIGEIDSRKLCFGGHSPSSAFMCGSIKYRPHFQLALSGYAGTLTLSSNLYGSAEDREKVEAFLRAVEEELSV